MLKRSIALCAILALSVAQAVAQQTQPPQGPPWYGQGPWAWGDGYGWSFWWMCPMMMVVMYSGQPSITESTSAGA